MSLKKAQYTRDKIQIVRTEEASAKSEEEFWRGTIGTVQVMAAEKDKAESEKESNCPCVVM
jgi:hypothetical protein